MAIFFPGFENIGRLTVPPTEGESQLLSIIGKEFDDSHEVYFNPYLDGDRPDVIVLKPGCGALVIEVKDWRLSHYRVGANNQWRYQDTVIRSPQQQVFRYKDNLFNLHLPILGLQHLRNRFFYGLISVGVYFHRATKNELNHLYGVPLNEMRERILQLNQDRLNVSQERYDKEMDWLERQRFKLNRDLGISWGVDSIVKRLRAFGKIKRNPLFTADIYEDFKRRLRPPLHVRQQGVAVTFDAKQHALTVSHPGFAKVKGVAGCGKTTILAQRAINSHKRHAGQILILTYNITLRYLST